MYLESAPREPSASFNGTTVSLYKELLHLDEAWQIKEVRVDRDCLEVHVYIEYTGKKARCPMSGEICRIHAHIPERTWRHLDTMHYTTWLHCSVPRVMNKESKVTTIEVPWADYSKRYTHLFAAAVTAFLNLHKIKKSTAAFFRTSIRVVNAILKTAGHRNMQDVREGDIMVPAREIGIADPVPEATDGPYYNHRLNRETHVKYMVYCFWLMVIVPG